MATDHIRLGALQPHELRAEKQEEILRFLRAGMALGAAAKRAGVAKSTVLNCARRHGITNYARGKAGRPAGSYGKTKAPVSAVAVSEARNLRAMAASLRWNSGLGGGWL